MGKGQNRVELLAPAGNAEAFFGAVAAGADAVYLAGDRFGARAYAENFTTESLLKCIRYAHLHGRRVYLAVNTLFKEKELAELGDYLTPFYEAELDAVIVQDLGALRFIREHFPGLQIHASTQMTLCCGCGAALLKRMGASRIVPARELSLEELAAVRRHTDIELETFIHGAMCYCYSGQCLFSSILGGRSGNRGRCAQPCRLPYSVTGGKASGKSSVKTGECYPLSLKDMCTIRLLPKLIEAGIDSFKIEGRMKKPEYAAGVTAVYRKYIDRYYELRRNLSPDRAGKAYHVEEEDWRLLTSLYIRSEVQEGYYFRKNGREMVTLDSPAYSGNDEAMLAGIAAEYLGPPRRLPVAATGWFQTGSPASVSLAWRGLTATVTGAAVEPAKNQPVTEENVKKQLGRLGDSCFEAGELRINVSEDAFYPLGQINELRRRATEELERLILEKNGYGTGRPAAAEINPGLRQDEPEAFRKAQAGQKKKNPAEGQSWAVSLRTMEQLKEMLRYRENGKIKPCRLYVEGDLLIQEPSEALSFCRELSEESELWITLPYVLRLGDTDYMERLYRLSRTEDCFRGFLARSLDEVGFLAEKSGPGTIIRIRADAGLYAWNKEAAMELSERGVSGICLPYELKAGEQAALINEAAHHNEILRQEGLEQPEKIVYSRIPMMITANCVQRTTDGCRKGGGEIINLTDRYKKRFPVLKNCLHCMNIIYNSVPFSLCQERTCLRGVTRRLDFTLESGSQMRAVLGAFWEGEAFPFDEYTTGHEKRDII